MENYVSHRFVSEELSLSTEMLLSVWRNILLQDPSSHTLSSCVISVRRLGSFPAMLTLTVVLGPHTTSEEPTLGGLAQALVNSVQEATSKTSKTSFDPS